MLVWALILVVTVKYVFVTMRADNHGEGGSFALLALLKRVAPTSRLLPYIGAAAIVATALFYGDAIITPAISILSAVEGLSLVDSGFSAWVVPAAVAIITLLFAVQKFGTGVIGGLFGTVMVGWFLTIAILGGMQLAANPGVLAACSPYYALAFFLADPLQAFFALGTVVLAITGAEALYADMGHFGRRAIAHAWLWFALPSLVLCYLGQAALVLADPTTIRSPFYLLAPAGTLVPFLVLAAVATVIASQSIISGAFSITQQAVQLGYLPRIDFRHTSNKERGQVYAPTINTLLFVAVVALTVGFGSSDALAAAFGMAVTATMVLTTLIIGFVAFRIWGWNPIWAAPLYVLLLALDLGLFAASSTKFADGGWLPCTIATVIILIFTTWHQGRGLVNRRLVSATMTFDVFLKSVASVHRVPATAVYLTSDKVGVPPALLHNLRNNLILHERIFIVTVETALTPKVDQRERIIADDLGDGLTRVVIRYGFIERPDVPAALAGFVDSFDSMRAAYFLSRQTLLPSRRPGMAIWREQLFAIMVQLSATPMSFFRLPVNRVVELGSQVEI